MASEESFVDYVCGQIAAAGEISRRKMFGEFGIYCDGKIVGLVCDNMFFLKITDAGRSLLQNPTEAPPYAGAKTYFLMENLEDTAFLAGLVAQTARALPEPKPKRPKQQKK